jgi:hypothetical protein
MVGNFPTLTSLGWGTRFGRNAGKLQVLRFAQDDASNKHPVVTPSHVSMSGGGASWAAGWLQGGQALVNGRQRWERLVRLGLIPVADGVEVVRAGVGVAVLDGRLEGFGEWDGRVEMEAVDAGAAAG